MSVTAIAPSVEKAACHPRCHATGLRSAQHVDESRQCAQPRAGSEEMHDIGCNSTSPSRPWPAAACPVQASAPRYSAAVASMPIIIRDWTAPTRRFPQHPQHYPKRGEQGKAQHPDMAEPRIGQNELEHGPVHRLTNGRAVHDGRADGEPCKSGRNARHHAPARNQHEPAMEVVATERCAARGGT